MLTQPVLVARLSTHAWVLGKGPALFSLRHRDGGETVEKLGFAAGVCVCVSLCVCVCVCVGWGWLECMFFFCLITKWTHCLSRHSCSFPTRCLRLTHSPPSGFWTTAVRGAESFITHFVRVYFESLGSPVPVRQLAALQKQCVRFVWTKSLPALGKSTSKKGRSLSFKAFLRKKLSR